MIKVSDVNIQTVHRIRVIGVYYLVLEMWLPRFPDVNVRKKKKLRNLFL